MISFPIAVGSWNVQYGNIKLPSQLPLTSQTHEPRGDSCLHERVPGVNKGFKNEQMYIIYYFQKRSKLQSMQFLNNTGTLLYNTVW